MVKRTATSAAQRGCCSTGEKLAFPSPTLSVRGSQGPFTVLTGSSQKQGSSERFLRAQKSLSGPGPPEMDAFLPSLSFCLLTERFFGTVRMPLRLGNMHVRIGWVT